MNKPRHFQKEIEKIRKTILSLGAMVEERVQKAGRLIESKNIIDAEMLIKSDYEIDEMEVEVEEECLKIVALYQPVASDLRFIIAVIKINNDLERIADEAVNIARHIEHMTKNDTFEFIFDYSIMVEKVEDMLKKSLDALVHFDTDIAIDVCMLDDEVDKIYRENYDMIKEAMEAHPGHIRYLLNLFLISRHLERIADHATNIAEEVIYMTEGEIVRHGKYLNEI